MIEDSFPDLAEFDRLLARARAGDEEAKGLLLERELERLRAFIRLKTGPAVRARESCSDLVQSACREALEDLDRIDCPNVAAFRQWLFQVALNKIRRRAEYWGSLRREGKREERVLVDDDERLRATYRGVHTPSRHAAAKEEVTRIEEAMDQLSEEQRDVIIQARILRRSHREIAEELGKSEEAVRQLLARARAKLGLFLAER